MKRMLPLIGIVALVLAGCTAPAHPPADSSPSATRDAGKSDCKDDAQMDLTDIQSSAQIALDKAIGAAHVPGGVASVALPDGRCLSVASGMADRELGFPMTIDHRFAGGSISKQFVAALIMKANLEGKLKLDDPISTYLKDDWWFSHLINGEKVTIRMLLAHTAGLADLPWEKLLTHPDYRNAVYGPNKDYAEILTEAGWFSLPAVNEPGAKFSYSDTHYVMLAFILESINKERFEVQVHRMLYRMGMMFTEPDGMAPMSGMAKGYFGDNKEYEFKELETMGTAPIEDGVFKMIYSQAHGGGWVVTSPRDLARWAWQWFSGRAFDGTYVPELTRETHQWTGDDNPVADCPDMRIGLGNTFWVKDTPLGSEYGGSGFDYGYGTYSIYFPKYDVAVSVQINTNINEDPRHIVLAVANEVLNKPLPSGR